jgi:putative acetyltransferase
MFKIREDNFQSEQSRSLLTLHLAGMRENSPAGCVFALELSGLEAPDVTVWSAWLDDRIASIGALKMLDQQNGEIKSMRTHPDFFTEGCRHNCS